jgi:PhoH-like ATPase
MNERKILVVDTSVLLYDMNAIHSFPGNDVVIPLTVLDELDRFKDGPGLLGESARYVNRYLDQLREVGRLDSTVELPDLDQSVRVEIHAEGEPDVPNGLDARKGDNRIIATVLCLKQKTPERQIKVVTKDINLRVKCDSLGIPAEDYYKDHIKYRDRKAYTGMLNLDLGESDVDEFFDEGSVDISRLSDCEDIYPNQFIVGKSSSGKSMLGVCKKDSICKLTNIELNEMVDVRPRNKEQKFALSLLNDPNIPLVTLTGIAGSGKTFLTLMAGLSGIYENRYKRIVITRSIQPVGRDLGFLPGDMDDKMDPWLAPLVDNFRHAFSDVTYFSIMREKGKIDVAPLSYIRGRTFNDSFVIVDEAQNATIHELKTIVTRIGKDSKVVLLGDTDQVDTPYIDSRSNGLTIVIEKFRQESIAGHMRLSRGQRSELASLASKIL